MNEERTEAYPESPLSQKVILAAIEVHRSLGPGVMESAYMACLCQELKAQKISFDKEVPLPLEYKGLRLDCGYRMDVVVGGRLILELKCVDKLLPIHESQLLTYLKLSGIKVGLLLNFNSPLMKHGIKRMIV